MTSILSAELRSLLRDVKEEKILTQRMRATLNEPDFEGFNVFCEPWQERPYDGWFHPSTHGLWTVRQLALYLADGSKVDREKMSLTSVLAIWQGKAWHMFLQQLWLSDGILAKDEVPLWDYSINVRGHTDGVLNVHSGMTSREGLEIKTMNVRTLPKITCWQDLKELKPGYYDQTQTYLAISGMRQQRYFIIATSYPYQTSEFVVPADPEYQQAQRVKYLKALRLAGVERVDDGTKNGKLVRVAEPTEAPVCCAPGSSTAKSCPVRRACPIGLAS